MAMMATTATVECTFGLNTYRPEYGTPPDFLSTAECMRADDALLFCNIRLSISAHFRHLGFLFPLSCPF
jgi:hypothetical protein